MTSQAPVLHFGNVTVTLMQGDVLEYSADAFCCPVDHACISQSGLYSVIQKRRGLAAYPLGKRKRLIMGEVVSVPTKNLLIPQVLLLVLYNDATGTFDRTVAQKAFRDSLVMAERMKVQCLSSPVLGFVRSHVDMDIICGSMIRAVRDFAEVAPAHLRKVTLFAFNEKTMSASLRQFFTYDQMAGSEEGFTPG